VQRQASSMINRIRNQEDGIKPTTLRNRAETRGNTISRFLVKNLMKSFLCWLRQMEGFSPNTERIFFVEDIN
jgi:hypothetical protein